MAKALYVCPDTMAIAARDGALRAGTVGEEPDCICGVPIPRGACCSAAGICTPNRTQQECEAAGGVYRGDGSICDTNTCRGACCRTTGACNSNVLPTSCASLNGVFQGFGSLCTPGLCPFIAPCCDSTGASCFASSCASNICTFTTQLSFTASVTVRDCCPPNFNQVQNYTTQVNGSASVQGTVSQNSPCNANLGLLGATSGFVGLPTCTRPNNSVRVNVSVGWGTDAIFQFGYQSVSDLGSASGSANVNGNCGGVFTVFGPQDHSSFLNCGPGQTYIPHTLNSLSVTVTVTGLSGCPGNRAFSAEGISDRIGGLRMVSVPPRTILGPDGKPFGGSVGGCSSCGGKATGGIKGITK